ncbi:hypothetical protein [Pedobacter jamesrossensis]|uniref:Uncharacterized protein n=1 Tax=Pedobacter jamesrossensis TaxID=1908238 RepID=A0ABV8NPC5_9SPHI
MELDGFHVQMLPDDKLTEIKKIQDSSKKAINDVSALSQVDSLEEKKNDLHLQSTHLVSFMNAWVTYFIWFLILKVKYLP